MHIVKTRIFKFQRDQFSNFVSRCTELVNISYQKTDKELKGDYFIVNIEKNLFFAPKNDDLKGSIIKFVANHNGVELREAAKLLKDQFLLETEHKPISREIPILEVEFHNYLSERNISREVAEKYEVGYVKQRSIMAGRIAFKVLATIQKIT